MDVHLLQADYERVLKSFELAALDPLHWVDVCADISVLLGARGATILGETVLERIDLLPHSASIDDLFEKYLEGGWWKRDVRAERGFEVAARQGYVSDHQIMDEAEMASHPFYAELVLPAGYRWFGATVARTGGEAWALVLQRQAGEEMFQRQELERLAGFRSHLQLAIRRSRALGFKRIENLESTFSGAERGFLALDATGCVGFMNATAETLLAEADLLSGKRLRSREPAEDAALQAILERVLLPTDGLVAPLPGPLPLRTGSGKALVLDAMPMPQTFQSLLAGAVAVITLYQVAELSPAADALRLRFGLTPREAALALELVAGRSLEELAPVLGISVGTARQHLKSIFRKTGTHRQGELVAVLRR